MKTFKLWVHQKAFSENELVINPKEFPDVGIGDILEIFHPDEQNSHLLLQVKSFKDDLQQSSKEIVSVEQGVASLFQLRAYKPVKVQRVQAADVALDLVELVFKDQYISRRDMWRLKNHLVDRCLHIQEKLELSGVRTQVQELWARGERVSCGAVTGDTRVAFRSATAMVYLFIQMSSEMWDFDTCGDLYWEKAVGFLTDLFTKWKEKGVNNEVTVILFSRTFFKAKWRGQFPDRMRDKVKVDYDGRFYQDYYRTVVHHERRDEWHGLLQTLKAHFTSYRNEVMCQAQPADSFPQGYNSTAAEGNFLETLNMALNVFDKHYVDRNFERTGQLVVLLTPGAGVFEVDREMCKITRQRMIDYGIGSDLVCLAEQPLHAVPLFKFHNKTRESSLLGGDYNIPHWLNYSFYTKKECLLDMLKKFKPRIKLADKDFPALEREPLPLLVKDQPPILNQHALLRHLPTERQSDDIEYETEEYDAQVFSIPSAKSPKPRTPSSMRPSSANHHRQQPTLAMQRNGSPQNQWNRLDVVDHTGRNSSPGTRQSSYHSDDGEASIAIPGRDIRANPLARLQKEANILSRSFESRRRRNSSETNPHFSPQSVVVGSAGAIHDTAAAQADRAGQNPPRALVNPFGTSNLMVKLTSNRRRWTHTFPQGPTGGAIQTHHRHHLTASYYSNYFPIAHHPSQSSFHRSHRNSATLGSSPSSPYHQGGYLGSSALGSGGGARTPSDTGERGAMLPPSSSEQRLRPSASGSSLISAGSSPSTDTVLLRPGSASTTDHGMRGHYEGFSSLDLALHPWLRRSTTLLGVTGDQEWTPHTLTGVDWKSLTATACLPVTTDFFPDRYSLEHDFVENNYELLAEDDVHGPFTTVEAIFHELISQRLLQGFQLVVIPNSVLNTISRSTRHPPLVTMPNKGEYVLSIGRFFHKLSLDRERKVISVTMYKPRHTSQSDFISIKYTYELWSVQNEGYASIHTSFEHKDIDKHNWNYLDNYISVHDSDFTLIDSLKFWRSRFMLVPNVPALVKRFADETGVGVAEAMSHDRDHALRQFQTESFLRFVEILNGIRRQTSTSRGAKASTSGRHTPISATDQAHPGSRSSPGPGSDRQRHASGTGSPAPIPPPTLTDDPPLTLATPLPKIARAMMDPSYGLRFLPSGQKGIPPNCFVSGEAMAWVQRSLSGDVTELEAFELLKNMQENRLIQHASGYAHISFVHGFYIYCLLLPENVPAMTDPSKASHAWQDHIPRLQVNSTFPSKWFEVAVMDELGKQKACETRYGSSGGAQHQEGLFNFRSSHWSTQEGATGYQGFTLGSASSGATGRSFKPPDIRNVMLEIDCNKTDRTEWCHVTYDGNYRTDRAFDFQVEWLVCTPGLLNDMLQGWARKANTFGFHLVPAPTNPFHQYPNADNILFPFANPLRCALLIHLDFQALCPRGGDDAWDDEGVGWGPLQPGDRCIDLLQECILRKLGFIQIHEKQRSPLGSYGFHSASRPRSHEYIHKSGVCFVKVVNSPDDLTLTSNMSITTLGQGQSSSCRVVRPQTRTRDEFGGGIPIMVGRDSDFDIVDASSEPVVEMKDQGRRIRSGSIKEVRDHGMEASLPSVGFLWSMNHMLTKRWRCGACGDEKLYDTLMRDLIDLSRDVDGRLREFWRENRASFQI